MSRSIARAAIITGTAAAAAAGLGAVPGEAATTAALPPGTITASLGTFAGSQGMLVDQASDTAYVQLSDGTVRAVSLATGTQAYSANITGLAALNSATGTLYAVQHNGSSLLTITVIDAATGAVTSTLPLKDGATIMTIAVDESTGLLYAGTARNGILVIDPASGAIAATIPRTPNGLPVTSIVLDSPHHLLYYAQGKGDGAVWVADMTTNTTLKFIPVHVYGSTGFLLSLNPTGTIVNVTDGEGYGAYSTSTGAEISTAFFPGTDALTSAAYSATTGNVYQVIGDGNTVHQVDQISSATGAVTGTILLPQLGTVALDDATSTLVYVTGVAAGSAILIIPLKAATAITSAAKATFTTGKAGNDAITAAGTPPATFRESGKLPSGITLSPAGTLAGTPAAGTSGTYKITITARNGIGGGTTQAFTLTVDQPPKFTTATSVTMPHGHADSYAIRTSGYPAATLTWTGALPAGVKITARGSGYATINGTPPASARGHAYTVRITAKNAAGTATQTLTVHIS